MLPIRQALLLACVLATIGCASSPAAPSSTTTSTLGPGETVSAGGVTVRFVGVLSDSRCPLDAACISAGEAIVAFTTVRHGRRGDLELTAVNVFRRSGAVGDVLVELQNLEPVPSLARPIDPEDYRATIRIGPVPDVAR